MAKSSRFKHDGDDPDKQRSFSSGNTANDLSSSPQFISPSTSLTLLHIFESHIGVVNSVFWSPDGKWLASFSADGIVQLWNPATGKLSHIFEGYTGAEAWSPDGNLLALNGVDGIVQLWDPTSDTPLRSLPVPDSSDSVSRSPYGQLLASYGGYQNAVRLWDPTTGKHLRSLIGHTEGVYNVAWSPNGKLLASCAYDGTIRLWDLTSGWLLHTQLTWEISEFACMVWSPDSKLLAACSTFDGTVMVWDPSMFEDDASEASPEISSENLLSRLTEKLVIWKYWKLVYSLEGHTDSIHSVVWSPGGDLLVLNDGTVRLWNPTTGVQRRTLEGFSGLVSHAAWSPDGKLLALCSKTDAFSGDAEVRIWRTDTWESLAVLTGLKGLGPVAWHPHLPMIIIAVRKDVYAWHLDLARLLRAVPSPEIVHYTDVTRVVLVGDNGVGKPSLTFQDEIATRDFDVFLCYQGQDKEVVKHIGEQLKHYGILPWLDEWELRPGLPWQRLLEQQITQMKAAAVFVGKSGIGPWQHQELDAFLREFVQRGCPVIPVLLADAPQEPALPVFLKAMTWVDFRSQNPDPMKRLLWGITGKREMSEEIW